jgi:CHAD domain-containing protein
MEEVPMDTAVRFPTSPKAAKAVALKLNKRMSVEEAFQAIVRNCVGQMQDNAAGVARYPDLEFLHQMRIALRRLDAAFALFGELVAVPPAIANELEWLGAELGPARDWDVFLESTLPRVAGSLPGNASIEPVRAAARAQRELAHARASDAVSSARFSKLIGEFERWCDQRAWRDDISGKQKTRLKMRVGDFAEGVLAQEQQRLLKRGRKLKEFGTDQLHRARIGAKRARYAAQFFESLFPGKQVRPYVQALRSLQDELGWFNDAAVATRLLDEICEHNDALQEGPGPALVRGYLAAVREQSEDRARKLWKKFAPVLPQQ